MSQYSGKVSTTREPDAATVEPSQTFACIAQTNVNHKGYYISNTFNSVDTIYLHTVRLLVRKILFCSIFHSSICWERNILMFTDRVL